MATIRWEMDRQLVLLIRQCAIPETKKKHQCKLINFGRTSACFKQILRILWLPYSWCALKIFSVQKCFAYLILGSTHKVVTPPWYGGGGGWGGGWLMESLPWVSDMVQFKRFYLQWKAFDFLEKMRRILWIVTLLKACDVIFSPRIRNHAKTARIGNFLCLTSRITHK